MFFLLLYGVTGRGGASKRRRLILLLSVGWLPPYLHPSGACLALGTRVAYSLLTPPRVAPNRGCVSSDGRWNLLRPVVRTPAEKSLNRWVTYVSIPRGRSDAGTAGGVLKPAFGRSWGRSARRPPEGSCSPLWGRCPEGSTTGGKQTARGTSSVWEPPPRGPPYFATGHGDPVCVTARS
jgi:hypothetical protein